MSPDGHHKDHPKEPYSIESDGLRYTIENEEAVLIECDEVDSRVLIPESVDGCPVVRIDDEAFCNCDRIKSVHIPNSVKEIGQDTFDGCSKLRFVKIPDSVTSIGDGAFALCESLNRIMIPDSVTSIGDGAFAGCKSLYNIYVDEYNPNYISRRGILYDRNGALVAYPIARGRVVPIAQGTKEVRGWTFYYDKPLESVDIPDSVTTIGDFAFGGCESLRSVCMSRNLLVMKEGCFEYCSSLESIDIPDTVSVIERKAFEGCVSLKTVRIPPLVTTLGFNTFTGCSSLGSIEIAGPVEHIDKYAFQGCESLYEARISARARIDERVFPEGCDIVRI